jgi:hypothetical protein
VRVLIGAIWGTITLALVVVSPARADMYPDASNAKLPVARTNLGLGTIATQDADALVVVPFPASVCPGANPVDMLSVNVGSYPKADEMPACTLQGIKSALVVPNTYTQEPWPPAAFAAYMTNNNNVWSTGHSNSAVMYFGSIGTGTDRASAYGENLVISNAPQPIFMPPTSGSGHDLGFMVGLELDFNVYKKAGSNPLGHLFGLLITGGSEAVPVEEAFAVKIEALDSAAGTQQWRTLLVGADGASPLFASVGAVSAGAVSNSQTIRFQSWDSGTRRSADIFSDASGDFIMAMGQPQAAVVFKGPTGGPAAPIFMMEGTLAPANYMHVLAAGAGSPPELKASGTDTNVNLLLRPQGAGHVQISGGLPGAAGGGGLYVCADNTGQLYAKATCP